MNLHLLKDELLYGKNIVVSKQLQLTQKDANTKN